MQCQNCVSTRVAATTAMQTTQPGCFAATHSRELDTMPAAYSCLLSSHACTHEGGGGDTRTTAHSNPPFPFLPPNATAPAELKFPGSYIWGGTVSPPKSLPISRGYRILCRLLANRGRPPWNLFQKSPMQQHKQTVRNPTRSRQSRSRQSNRHG